MIKLLISARSEDVQELRKLPIRPYHGNCSMTSDFSLANSDVDNHVEENLKVITDAQLKGKVAYRSSSQASSGSEVPPIYDINGYVWTYRCAEVFIIK